MREQDRENELGPTLSYWAENYSAIDELLILRKKATKLFIDERALTEKVSILFCRERKQGTQISQENKALLDDCVEQSLNIFNHLQELGEALEAIESLEAKTNLSNLAEKFREQEIGMRNNGKNLRERLRSNGGAVKLT